MLERQQGIGGLARGRRIIAGAPRRGADMLAVIFQRAEAAYQARGKRFALMKGRFSCRRTRRIHLGSGAARLNPGYACCHLAPNLGYDAVAVTGMPRWRDAGGDGGKVMGGKTRLSCVVTVLLAFAATTGASAQGPDARAALEAKAAAAYGAKSWANAESAFKQLVAMDPSRLDYRQSLANAQLNLGHYPDALASADAAIAIAEKSAQGPEAAKAKAALGPILVTKGNILLKQHRVPDAIAAYEKAAPLAANPATAYFNLCATLYNTGSTQGALAACDKAIAADPKKADAYFIKGSVLYADATMQNGKIVPSKAALAALRQYLLLAPNGAHVADVKQMLDAAK
ncbi:MAG TPA: hypothetical protein VII40_01390 [Xanthobacteraceae bacterium]